MTMPMSSTEPGFTPRKEFIRDKRTVNAFCLLAVSGSSCIRLYAFPIPVVNSIRRLFEQRQILSAFREDVVLNQCEFTLDAKPWSNPKSINSEKLLLDVLAIIYQHGYAYLSCIDYGRESDDRLAVAFSKPSAIVSSGASARSASPLPMSAVAGVASGSSLSHHPSHIRVPFALSFASATLLRVINPPLYATPAILQAVRGAWPRGVVSEKKIGSSFEFKLKGYKCKYSLEDLCLLPDKNVSIQGSRRIRSLQIHCSISSVS